MDYSEKILEIKEIPCFTSYTITKIELFKRNTEYFAVIQEKGFFERIYPNKKTINLDKAKTEKLISKLFKTQIPLFPKDSIGMTLDGSSYELNITNGEVSVLYKWDNKPPKEWLIMQTLWNYFIESLNEIENNTKT